MIPVVGGRQNAIMQIMTHAAIRNPTATRGTIVRPNAGITHGQLKQPSIVPGQTALGNDLKNCRPDLGDNGQIKNPARFPFGNRSLADTKSPRELGLSHSKDIEADKSNRMHARNISFKDRLSTIEHSYHDLESASAIGNYNEMAHPPFTDPILGSRLPRAVQSDSFGQRLRRIRNLKGLTQEQLADQLSLTELQIGRWERDEALPKSKNLSRLSEFFQVPEIWLSYGGERGPATVPVLGHVGAGAVVIPIEGDILEEIELPFSAPPDTRALKVRGDSMRPEISDGDFVVYRSIPEDPHVLVGKLVIAKLEDGRVLVKRLRRGKDINTFDLESTNAAPIENQRLVWCSRVRSVVFS